MTRLASGYRFRAAGGALVLSLALMISALPGHGQSGSLVFETGLEGEIWQQLPKFGRPSTCLDSYNYSSFWYDGPCADTAPAPGELTYPVDVAIYQSGALGADGFPVNPNDYRLYVTDSFNHRVVVYRFDPLANDDDPLDGYGWAEVDVPGAQWNRSTLYLPNHLTVDAAGNVIVADYWNERLVVFDSAGQVIGEVPVGVKVYGVTLTPGASWGAGGTIAVNGIDFSTLVNHLVFIDAQDGAVLQQYEAPVGDSTPGSLLFATGITYDETGSHVIVADLDNSRVVVWQTDANGLLVDGDAGDGIVPFSVTEDNPAGVPTMTPVLVFGRPADLAAPSRADLQSPFSVMVDQRGRIIVSDTDNQRLAVYRPSYPSSGPATAEFLFELSAKGGLNGFPRGVVEDAHGRLIVVDTANHEVEVFQIPSLAIVDVTVAGPRAHAPDVLRPGAVINTNAVAGDSVSVEFSVIVPEGRPGVVNVIPSCQVTDSLGLFEGADAPVGPTLIDWIPTALHTSLGANGEVGLIRPIDPASPSTSDIYRFRCTIVAREEGPLQFELFAVGNDGVTASANRTSEATVGCALCETGLPSISGAVTVPGPQAFYNTEATITLTALDQPDTVNVDDPRATLPAAGLKRVYWQWVYGPLAFDDPYWIGCDDFPDTWISCAGPGLADGDPDGFPYPVAPDAFEVDVQVADWYEGYQVLEFWAQDAAGNYSERQQIVVTLDFTPPTAAFAFPTPSGPCWVTDGVPNCWYNTSLNVPYVVFDNLTPSNQILVNGVAGASKPPLIFDQEGENAAVDFNLEDLATNQSTTSSADPFSNGRIAHIDRVAPETTLACSWTDGTITLDCSAGGTFVGGTATVTLTAADLTSGVQETRYRLNGGTAVLYTGPVALSSSGTTTFTWWSRDVAGNVETARSIVLGTNRPPVAQDGSMTLAEDAWASITLAATDPDSDPLTFAIQTGPSHGAVTLVPGGALATYTPNPDYHGPDSFTFVVDDGNGGTSIGTVSITVTPRNDAPTLADQTVTTPEDTPIDVTLAGQDIDGDALSYTVLAGPSNGNAAITGNVLTYTPAPDFHGTDVVTVQVSDGQGGTASATVTIIVTPVNDAPVIDDQTVTTPEDTSIDVTLGATDADGDALTYTVASGPADGAVVIANGVLTYTPALNFHGTDAIVVQVSDGEGGTDTATITIIVTPVDDPPSVGDRTITTPEDTAVSTSIGATHPDGIGMTYQITGAPANGTATLAGDVVTYTPAENFHGTDAVVVLVTDANGLTASATITVIVTPVNDPPVIDDQSVSTPEDTPIDVALGATDADGDALAYAAVGAPANGSAVIVNGVLTYTPAPDFNGLDTVTVRVSDGQGGTATAVITIDVTPVADPPVANDDTATVISGQAVVIDLLENDTDADGDALTVAIVSGPANGTVTVGVDGLVTYTSAPGFVGTDTFTYIASDGARQSGVATVTITVSPSNQPPFCGDAYGSPALTAWPPNHRQVTIDILGVTDPGGGAVTITVDSIWQDEPTNTRGDGNTNVDGGILPDGRPWVRAERMGGGQRDGRVYEIRFTASDGTASCTGTVFIGVPHDQRGTHPVDSGLRWNSMTGEFLGGGGLPGGGGGDDSDGGDDDGDNNSGGDDNGDADGDDGDSGDGDNDDNGDGDDNGDDDSDDEGDEEEELAYRTQSQGGWGSPASSGPGALLESHFSAVFGGAGVTVGGNRTLRFTSASAVRAFLPQGGKAGALRKSETNPTKKTDAGVFGGQVLALQLSVSFSNAGVTRSGLGGLRVTSGKLAGWTVFQVLALANAVLGGNNDALPGGVSLNDLNTVVDLINNNYVDGTTDNGYLAP